MTKRAVMQDEIDRAELLPIRIPSSAHNSDPISFGSRPEFYGLDDLKKVAIKKHARTDEFEKRLMGIWWIIGERPVPFIFRTADGELRSLDAGCLGFLVNQWKPEILAEEKDGVILAVEPTGALVDRYLAIKDRLIAALSTQ